MKTHLLISIILLLGLSSVYAQNAGTLKVFSEDPVVVYVDETQYPTYDAIPLAPGTHFVRALNKEGAKIYSNIVTITAGEVTTVLIEAQGGAGQPAAAPGNQQVTQGAAVSQKGAGTLNIFSEFTGTTIYLDDIKQGEDVKSVNGIPAGNHYLKVMKDGVGIFGELIAINPGQTTSVLIKNDGQVAEKIMESKSQEREEYQSKKVDVIFTTNSVSTTQGASTLFPGFYGYYGYSSSVTNTSQISDFKIIQGGVKEIGDLGLANLAGNQNVLNRYASISKSVNKHVSIGVGMFLGGLLIGGPVLVDILVDKPFLHPDGTKAPDWEIGVATAGIVSCTIGYAITMGADKKYPRHYYSVDAAAKDAQEYNRKLKEKLGLPESYDVK
ncbi:MAG: PEGA domain-containing protein [Bacteroidales bacterium]|nr:PEGA domain-containing protein [Bacteroidales bacterium]